MPRVSTLLAQLVAAPIRAYRVMLSPFLPRVCRFHPSCSAYALGAVLVHGPFRGASMAIRRLLRCHPLNAGGFDPLPGIGATDAASLLSEREPRLARQLACPQDVRAAGAPPLSMAEGVSPSRLRK